MSTETWKPIAGDYEPGFYISDHGNIINDKGVLGRPLGKSYDVRGYCRVSIRKNGKVVAAKAHRLVLFAFDPMGYFEGAQVNHKDGNKENNRLNNLEWCTAKHNTVHA